MLAKKRARAQHALDPDGYTSYGQGLFNFQLANGALVNLVKGTPSDDEENRCEARNQSPCEPLNAISGDRFRTSAQRGSIHNPFQRTVGRRMRRSECSALRFGQRTRLKFCFPFHFNRRTLFIFVVSEYHSYIK